MGRNGLMSALALTLLDGALVTSVSAQLEPRPNNTATPSPAASASPTDSPGPTLPTASVASPTPAAPPSPAATLAITSAAPVSAATTTPSPTAGAPTDPDALVLVEADMPPGLDCPGRTQSRPQNFLNVQGSLSMAVCLVPPAQLGLTQPAGAIAGVTNVVHIASDSDWSGLSLDDAMRSALFGVSWGGTANFAVDLLPDPPVGDESRASAVHSGDASTNLFVMFRRGPVFAMLQVEASGGSAPIEESLRLARILDARIMVAGYR